ncbi:MAG: helix-turn-helix domain-containing protein, partial [Acidimicrobiia bacterium]
MGGLLHPDPAAVSAPLFAGAGGFFLAADKVQVKYEMLRAHAVDGLSATAAARAHGYSRAAFYLVAAAFEAAGVAGLLDERRGRKGPVKLSSDILAFLHAGGGRSGAACGWWEGRAEEDLERAAASGQNSHRLSLEWSRLEPEPGRYDDAAFTRYRGLLESCHR